MSKVIYFSDKSLKNRYLLYTWVFFLNWNLPSDLALQKAPGNRRQTISKTLLNSNFIFFFAFWFTFPTTFLISKQKRSYPSGSLFSTEVTKRAFLLLLLLCVHYTLKRIWGARKKYPSNGSWACKTPSTKWKVELNLRSSSIAVVRRFADTLRSHWNADWALKYEEGRLKANSFSRIFLWFCLARDNGLYIVVLCAENIYTKSPKKFALKTTIG